jgi:hypothetical protein
VLTATRAGGSVVAVVVVIMNSVENKVLKE